MCWTLKQKNIFTLGKAGMEKGTRNLEIVSLPLGFNYVPQHALCDGSFNVCLVQQLWYEKSATPVQFLAEPRGRKVQSANFAD